MVFTGQPDTTGTATFTSASRLQVCVRNHSNSSYFSDCLIGDSIAINGICLTLVDKTVDADSSLGYFDVMLETRNVASWGAHLTDNESFFVMVEKALMVHHLNESKQWTNERSLMTGHVTGTSRITDVSCNRLTLTCPVSSDLDSTLLYPFQIIFINGICVHVLSIDDTNHCVSVKVDDDVKVLFESLQLNHLVNIEILKNESMTNMNNNEESSVFTGLVIGQAMLYECYDDISMVSLIDVCPSASPPPPSTSPTPSSSASSSLLHSIAPGDVLCVDGIRMTVTHFDWIKSHGKRLWLKLPLTFSWKFYDDRQRFSAHGLRVNIEKALTREERLGGHRVLGCPSAVGQISLVMMYPDGSRDIWITWTRPPLYQFPSPNPSNNTTSHPELNTQSSTSPVVYKGSIAIDGVSLTVASVNALNSSFRVSLIPHSLRLTTLGDRRPGDWVKLEFDDWLRRGDSGETSTSTNDNSQTLTSIATNSDMSLSPITPAATTTTTATTAVTRVSPLEEFVDDYFMQLAIDQGNLGRLTAPPNPWVGCVIVKYGRLLGQGYHQLAGTPHAEVHAINDVRQRYGDMIHESTMYVTLEPCHHYGRTPPCDLQLIKQRLRRVVISIVDPDDRVNGQGLALLKSNNIFIKHSVLYHKTKLALLSYLYHRHHHRPFVIVKAATSIDNKINCSDGSSKWITNEQSRAYAHQIRAKCQAIIIGSTTVLKDNPMLTVRLPNDNKSSHIPYHQPLRVVLDSRGRVTSGYVLDTTIAATLIFTTSQSSVDTHKQWKDAGCEIKIIPSMSHITRHSFIASTSPSAPDEARGVCIGCVVEELGRRGILQVLVEGGPTISSSFLLYSLCHIYMLWIGNGMIGCEGQSAISCPLTPTIASLKRWHLLSHQQFVNDICVEYSPEPLYSLF